MTPISNIINRLWLLSALLRRALGGLLHACFGVELYGPLGVCQADGALDGEDATRPGVRYGKAGSADIRTKNKEQRTNGLCIKTVIG